MQTQMLPAWWGVLTLQTCECCFVLRCQGQGQCSSHSVTRPGGSVLLMAAVQVCGPMCEQKHLSPVTLSRLLALPGKQNTECRHAGGLGRWHALGKM